MVGYQKEENTCHTWQSSKPNFSQFQEEKQANETILTDDCTKLLT
jgi:hypothetical protein